MLLISEFISDEEQILPCEFILLSFDTEEEGLCYKNTHTDLSNRFSSVELRVITGHYIHNKDKVEVLCLVCGYTNDPNSTEYS